MYLQPTLLKGYVVVLDREKAQYGRIIDFIFNFVKAEYIKAVPFCSQKQLVKMIRTHSLSCQCVLVFDM